MEPLQKRIAGGCHLTRDVPALVRAAGFEVVDLDEDYLPGPSPSKPWGYVYRGRAIRGHRLHSPGLPGLPLPLALG